MENTAQPTPIKSGPINQQQEPNLQQQNPKSLTPQPLPTFEEPSFKLPIFIIFGLIILFFVIMGLYLSFGKNTLPFTKSSSPTPIISVSQPTEKFGISTHWTTFTSSFDYSIKYPTDWKIYKSSWTEEPNSDQFNLENDDEVVLRFRETDQASPSSKPNGIIIRLKKPASNPDNLSIREWMKKNYPALSLIKTEGLKIADINSIKATSLLGGQVTYILTPYKDKIYQIVKQSFGAGSSYDYDQIFSQILTTVEFTTQATPSSSP